jgi:uncharacterized protein YbaR (Trm112 family)
MPPAQGLVLDLGSGQDAHPRADLIIDKYVADDFERGGGLDVAKPLIVGDGHSLPLADDAVGYVIASHVVEHATDPIAFAGEIARVGKAGFVQVPTREAELTFGWPFHPWLIDREGDVLVFHPRNGAVAPHGGLFHGAFADSAMFSLWFGAHRERWHHTLHWVGSFSVRVEGESRAEKTADLDIERTLRVLAHMGARGPVGSLWELMRCPLDRGQLHAQGDRLLCERCARSFPVSGGVPVLLPEAAV